MKSVQIRSYFCPFFPIFGLNKISVFSPNTGKYEPEITLYLNFFHAVVIYVTTTEHRYFLILLLHT